jgi:hypothetical protein
VINLPSGAEAHPIEAISIGTAKAVPFQSRSFEMVRLPSVSASSESIIRSILLEMEAGALGGTTAQPDQVYSQRRLV